MQKLHPDVVIMDIAMPELNGVEATALLHDAYPSTQVLILSMHSATEHIFRALQAGKELLKWPVYKPEQQSVIKFGSKTVSADTEFYARHKCKFWNDQGYSVLFGPCPTPTALGPVNQ